MALKDIQPIVELALAHLRLVQEGLDGIQDLIKRGERNEVLGGLVVAQDHLRPMSTLIDAAILVAKSRSH